MRRSRSVLRSWLPDDGKHSALATVSVAASTWICIGAAVSVRNGAYWGGGAVLVSMAWVGTATAIFYVNRSPRVAAFSSFGLYYATVLAVLLAVEFPAGIYGHGSWLVASRDLTVAAALIAALLVPWSLSRAAQRMALTLISVMVGTSAVAMIRASPRPAIDVWYMYQAASTGILHGLNPYGLHWSSGIIGEVANGFSYLPGSALMLAPFQWLFGDVRYGLIAATLATTWLVFRLADGRFAWLLAAFVLLFPKLMFGIEQSWNDPLLLALIAGFVVLADSGRLRWAVVVLAVAVACIQYGLILLPLAAWYRAFGWRRCCVAAVGGAAIVLPWSLDDWTGFWHSVVLYPLRLPPRPDSLSLYTVALHHGHMPGVFVLAGATAVTAVAFRALLGTSTYAFAAVTAAVFATFVILNKQVFYNDWQFVALLVVIVAAVRTQEREQSQAQVSMPVV